MPVISGLEWTFDTAAAAYEKMRPGYPEELYRTLFDYVGIGKDSRVLEVGSGGGQATGPLLQTGCHFTAVEYGENFSALLKKKFGAYDGFSVVTDKFEDAELAKNAFDLVYSASAFHWIPEKIGYEKAYSLLKKGGVFARFANHPYRDKGNPALSDEIDRLYDEYYYTYHRKTRQPLREYTHEQSLERAMIASRYGFTQIQHHLFYRQRVFSAPEYIQLLGTYSDHIAIEESIRNVFFSKVGAAITRHGGSITIYDTIDLQLARKP